MFKTLLYISLLSTVLVTACNKNIEVGMQANYTGPQMVNFNNYMDDNGNFGYYKYAASLKDSFIMANIEIKLTNTTAPAAQDITIYLRKVDALVTEYNTNNGTDLTPVPNTSAALNYDFTKPVILKKGERSVIVPIYVNAIKFDLSKSNAIGIAIDKVEGAVLNAGVQSQLVVEFSAVNQYQGTYKSNGYVYHPTAPRAINDRTKFVATAGTNSVVVELGDLGASGYSALLTITGTSVAITAAPGAAGAPYTMFTTGLPTTNPGYTAAWAGSSSCNNTYNPATKTFYLRYGYMGANGWRVTEEVLVKQ